MWLHKTFLSPPRTCWIFHRGGSEQPDSENGTFQNCHFAHFHHTAAARADTWGYWSCIGIHRALCQLRVPSAYRQRWPFPCHSHTRWNTRLQSVTHPVLKLILTIMGKDGKLNIPQIVKLNIILHESDVRVPNAAGCLFIFMRLTRIHINPH